MSHRLSSTLIYFILTANLGSAAYAQTTPYDAVDPFIGTSGGGNTFPGASWPFGMVQWSPDTNKDAWYLYGEKPVRGFSLTHLSGAGCPLYGDFAVLPVAAGLGTSPGSDFGPYAAAFDHAKEEAHPGFYAVTLSSGIRVELTVTERAGIARFSFPEGVPSRILVSAGSSADVLESLSVKEPGKHTYENRIQLDGKDSYAGSATAGGFCWTHSQYKIYAAGRFNKPYRSSAVWQDDRIIRSRKAASGRHTGAWLDFGNEREVELKVGVSFVSEDGARNNMNQEIADWDFERVRARSSSVWRELLQRVTVDGGTRDQRTIFYTGLYHSFLAPTLFSDGDGRYIGFDKEVHSLSGSKQKAQYANFSDWDIYRNTVQLQTLFEPDRESDMMQSLVNDAVQSGWYPRWPAANDVTYVMGGDSPVIVISSAYAFGARSFDTRTALEYMLKAGSKPGLGLHNYSERPFLAEYLERGYVPVDKDRTAASRTLEYANADFAIAQFARRLGDQDLYQSFLKQSANWKSLLNPETGWIHPRQSDGSWLPGFDPERSLPKANSTDQTGFEEGNTYQYTFMLPFDYPALFAAVGADDKVLSRLDRFFLKLRCWGEPCYNIENEPDFVVPYAYTFAGQPWKTQEVVTRIAQETFKPTPDGIPGNDDLGATSGVYVWDALGFYPAVPGVDGLVMGTPMFDKATLHLAGGRDVVVARKGSGIYVQKLILDGVPYTNTWLPLSKLHQGTTSLEFSVAREPNKERGSAVTDRPPSLH